MALYIELAFQEKVLSTATAFVFQSGPRSYLITNRHNVSGRRSDNDQPVSSTGGIPDKILIHHNKIGGGWITKTEWLIAEQGQPLWCEHPHWGKTTDMAALRLTDLEGVILIPYSLEENSPILIGPSDYVSVVGFPFGLKSGGSMAIWATGFVATEPEVDHDGLPLFLVDCRTRRGQSGSAVIAHRCSQLVQTGNLDICLPSQTRFLGLYSGRVNLDADLGFVWKARAIKEMVDSIP